MLTKQEIRSKILLRLKTQKEEVREQKSEVIKRKLFRLEAFKKAKTVMFYIAFKGEVKTDKMIKAARRLGKLIAVPVCERRKIALKPCILEDNTGLIKGPYGVPEPAVRTCVSLAGLDLVIVPGVAFDHKGSRLGRGKGYYDRFLSKIPKSTKAIGLAFDFQILPVVPSKTHDVGVNKVIFA